jgi:hypothetical protein
MFLPEEKDKGEALLSQIINHAVRNTGHSWGAVIRREDGTLFKTVRKNRPCWGELRRYEDGTRPQDFHPTDIPNVIDKGQREALAISLLMYKLETQEDDEAVKEFIFSTEGPWRRGMGKDVTLHRGADGRYAAVSMTDTEIDPTVLLSALVGLRVYLGARALGGFAKAAEGKSPREKAQEFLVRAFISVGGARRVAEGKNAYDGISFANLSYCLTSDLSFERFATGDSLDLSNGRTFRDQEDYNRPDLALVFGGEADYNGSLLAQFTEKTGLRGTGYGGSVFDPEVREKLEEFLRDKFK